MRFILHGKHITHLMGTTKDKKWALLRFTKDHSKGFSVDLSDLSRFRTSLNILHDIPEENITIGCYTWHNQEESLLIPYTRLSKEKK